MKSLLKLFAPPPEISVSDWVSANRNLSPENSAEPGRINLSRTPYVLEILNCVQRDDVKEVVIMAGSQVGKSLSMENILAYWVGNSPGPILYLLPTDSDCQKVSKTRITPMIRDSETLKNLFSPSRKHVTENTIKNKKFVGGSLNFGSFGNPRDVSSMAIQYLICDEIDRNPDATAGREGDSITLAKKRLVTYQERSKFIACSTPSIKNESRIESMYEESDQRRFYLPCPACKHKQVLMFAGFKWDKTETGEHLPETTYYECVACKAKIYDHQKKGMLDKGVWIADKPFNGSAGFWINGFYSPFQTWTAIISEWVNVNASKDLERKKAFINTVFAETWEEKGEVVKTDEIMERAEPFNPNEALPDDVLFMTASVDVQQSVLSVMVAGWARGKEMFGIERRFLFGNTSQPDVWAQLEAFIADGYPKNVPAENRMKPAIVFVDSGFNTQTVYDFCKKNHHKNYWAIKGFAGSRPILTRPKRGTANVIIVGVDDCKDRVFNSLRLEEIGPEYYHFPANCNGFDLDFYREITAEQKKTKFVNGFASRYWSKVSASRANEGLDNLVYNLAALHMLNPDWNAFKKVVKQPLEAKEAPQEQPIKQLPKPEPRTNSMIQQHFRKQIRGTKSNWVNKY